MTSTSTARPSLLPPDAHLALQTLAVVTTPMSRYRPQGLASSHKTKTQARSFSQARHPFRMEASPEHPRGKDCCLTREIPGSSQAILLVLSSRRLLDDSACSHRLRGLPSSARSPFTASPESPCASEARSLILAGNGRTSTAPSRPQRGSLAHCQARILQWPTNQGIPVQTRHAIRITSPSVTGLILTNAP